MSILVTGSTGRIGSQVVNQLAASGASVRALTRAPEKATFPTPSAATCSTPTPCARHSKA